MVSKSYLGNQNLKRHTGLTFYIFKYIIVFQWLNNIMENMTIKKSIRVTGGLFLSLFIFTGVFAMTVENASAQSFQPACPFSSQSGRTIVHFDDQNLTSGIRSDIGSSRSSETRSVSLPAGTYNISLQSFDGGSAAKRLSDNQPNERYFLQLKNGNTIVARTNSTSDLSDSVSNPVWYGRVNSSLTLSQAVNTVVAMHAVYPDTSSPNSVNVGCAAFDLVSAPAPVVQTLTGSCSVTPSSVNAGGYLNWSATASGGTGSYDYSWTGTDSLYGNSSYVSKPYFVAGTKIGTITITSGSQSITRSCSATVAESTNNSNINVSCSASPSSVDIDEDVTWHAYASGGDGDYDYDWSGTDGLEGDNRSVTWSYDDDGTKHGTVTVTSNGQSASASCSVSVDEEDNEDDLSVSCYANPSNPQIGERVRWYVDVDGGDGDYDYDWNGTNGLNSSSRSPYITYDTSGSKRATVTVTDGEGEEDSSTCYANINQNNVVLAYSQSYQPPMESAVYLSQIPYTGFTDNYKLAFFIGFLSLISAYVTYIVISYKKNYGEINS